MTFYSYYAFWKNVKNHEKLSTGLLQGVPKKWCVSLLLQQANAPFFLGTPCICADQKKLNISNTKLVVPFW